MIRAVAYHQFKIARFCNKFQVFVIESQIFL